jgi:hypothetical protein
MLGGNHPSTARSAVPTASAAAELGGIVNGKLASGVLAGVAALALAGVGSTLSAPTGGADIAPNVVRAGVLHLDLGADGQAGTTLSFGGILPGQQRDQLIWVAANDRASTLPGTLALTFGSVHDVAASCDTSLDKARAEITSGIAGCTVRDGQASGTPAQGNLSRKLTLDLRSAVGSAGACVADAAPRSTTTGLFAAGGRTIALGAGAGPVVLAPGQGVCVAVSVAWPETPNASPDPQHPLDNAAQGDSAGVEVRFDLTQVHR